MQSPASMHPLGQLDIGRLPSDIWAPKLADLDKLAQELTGNRGESLLRPEGNSVLIAGRKRGCIATRLLEELRILNNQVRSVRQRGTPQAFVEAASFFHLRFENIHPLRDGNGRVGRALLCAQCADGLQVPFPEIVAQLYAHERDYRMLFRAPAEELQFELLVDLVGRMLGVQISPYAPDLPYTLQTTFLDPKPLPAKTVFGRDAPAISCSSTQQESAIATRAVS